MARPFFTCKKCGSLIKPVSSPVDAPIANYTQAFIDRNGDIYCSLNCYEKSQPPSPTQHKCKSCNANISLVDTYCSFECYEKGLPPSPLRKCKQCDISLSIDYAATQKAIYGHVVCSDSCVLMLEREIESKRKLLLETKISHLHRCLEELSAEIWREEK